MSWSGSRQGALGVRRAFWAMSLFLGILSFATVGLIVGSSSPAWAPVFRISIRVAGHNAFPTGTVAKPYTAQLAATGGLLPVRWKLASGKLPSGLKLGVSTGKVAGKPTKKGRYAFVVQATDARKPPDIAKLTASITVK
jgi:hypothetical protein